MRYKVQCQYAPEDAPQGRCDEVAWWLLAVSGITQLQTAKYLCHRHMQQFVRDFAESPSDHLVVMWADPAEPKEQ